MGTQRWKPTLSVPPWAQLAYLLLSRGEARAPCLLPDTIPPPSGLACVFLPPSPYCPNSPTLVSILRSAHYKEQASLSHHLTQQELVRHELRI